MTKPKHVGGLDLFLALSVLAFAFFAGVGLIGALVACAWAAVR
jgi:hypothetical protein